MKAISAVLLALVLGVGCGKKEAVENVELPAVEIADPIVEKAIRENLKKPTGELTKADLAKVYRLVLSNTKITDAGLKDIAKLRQLRVLSLSETKITDAGLKDIAKLQQLTDLYLNNTQITDAGLEEVAKLQKLERLYLENTQITDAGMAKLRKALPPTCTILSIPTK